jgi:copper(I)-binding protein
MIYFFKQRFSMVSLLLALVSLLTGLNAQAENSVKDFVWNNEMLSVTDHWVRPTNAGQDVGAAYMTLKSMVSCELVKVSADVAGAVEIHSMTMHDGVMKMRQLKTLTLAKNKAVELAPGGFHLMLFDLKKPLTLGEEVIFDLTLKCKGQTLAPLKVFTKVNSPDAMQKTEHHHHHE